MVQDTLEAAADPQSVANGYIQDCETAEGVSFQMAAAPVQFDDEPAKPGRAPEFNEHGDAILGELGLDMGRHRGPQGPRRRRLIDPFEPTETAQERCP